MSSRERELQSRGAFDIEAENPDPIRLQGAIVDLQKFVTDSKNQYDPFTRTFARGTQLQAARRLVRVTIAGQNLEKFSL